jgi:hypothetical protein
MRLFTLIIISFTFICGCSHSGQGVLPGTEDAPRPGLVTSQSSRWVWSSSLFKVSADHTSIEKLPIRTSQLHLNVTPFVEAPNCNQCMVISKPQVQPDGTIKVNVMLTHPFPTHPEYTGFDVRGTVIFPATRYWKSPATPVVTKTFYQVFTEAPLYFSRAEDGGAQLLNQDGYSFYLFPGLNLGPDFGLPIFNYSKGKYAYGPDPDSTINGYKLFTKELQRRMFKVTDTITRTYHIAPPDGEFTFGYVVDASWAQPTTTPVTDPKNDFPFWANCEDGYVLGSEQITPLLSGVYPSPGHGYYDLFRTTFTTYPDVTCLGDLPIAYLLCPDIQADPEAKFGQIAYGNLGVQINPGVYEVIAQVHWGTYEAIPGQYLAIVIGLNRYYIPGVDNYPIQLLFPMYFDFLYLDVVDGG